MQVRKKWFVGAAVLACAVSPVVRGGTLGVAEDYNAFIFQNMNQTSDSEGALAVGGNFTVSSYSVASKLGTAGTHLIVGGNVSFTGGSMNGSAVIGGDATFDYIEVMGNITVGGSYNGGGFASGTIYYQGDNYHGPSWANHSQVGSVTVPMDFAQAKSDLTGVSAGLAGLSDTGTLTNYYGGLTFSGSAAGENIFSVDAAVLAVATGITVSVPAGGYAIINVVGATSVSLPNVGFSFDATNVLWNLDGVTNVSMQSFAGSVLAPSAAVSFSSGNLNGTLVADSLSGGGELHNYLFQHDFVPPSPPVASVPLPAGAVGGPVLLVVMAAVRGARHRRRCGNV